MGEKAIPDFDDALSSFNKTAKQVFRVTGSPNLVRQIQEFEEQLRVSLTKGTRPNIPGDRNHLGTMKPRQDPELTFHKPREDEP